MILLFHTTQSALRAEELLLEAGVAVDVVPRPEGAPGGLCGLALDVVEEELAEAGHLLAEAGIEYRLFDAGTGGEPPEAPGSGSAGSSTPAGSPATGDFLEPSGPSGPPAPLPAVDTAEGGRPVAAGRIAGRPGETSPGRGGSSGAPSFDREEPL